MAKGSTVADIIHVTLLYLERGDYLLKNGSIQTFLSLIVTKLCPFKNPLLILRSNGDFWSNFARYLPDLERAQF